MSRLHPPTPAHWSSYADFYRSVYGQVITSMRVSGRVGATLLQASQPAGDWSDGATPELVIGQQRSGPARVALDLGAGAFSCLSSKGDFLVAPPGCASKIVVDAAQSIRLVSIPWKRMRDWTDSEVLRLPADGDFGVLHQALNHDPRLTRALDALWQQDDGTSVAATLFSDAQLIEIVATLLELSRPARTRPVNGLTRHGLQRVDACMRARLSEDIGLADLAALTGLSVPHFCRSFKRATGCSPYQALVDLRMQHARVLLGTTPQSVAEVALACGYAQPAHFAKLFRRSAGVAPALWRRQRRS